MTSAVCDRARGWASLDLDGGLSTFEKRLLDRHLDTCDSCRAFATDAAHFTLVLREAALEPAHVALDLPRRRTRVAGVASGIAAAAAVAAAAVVAFGSGGGQQAAAPRTAARTLASGLATLATNADTLGVRRAGESPGTRVAGNVRGTFGLPT